MRSQTRAETPDSHSLSGRNVLILAFLISFPVIGLDQFLRIRPGQWAAQPGTEITHWLTDSMMAAPLFAIGILAADWIARRARLATDRPADAIKRAALITVACALVLAPAWFQVDRTTNPITAQPLVFPHAHDSGDVYWVASPVIIALACACLAPAVAWAAYRLTRRRARHHQQPASSRTGPPIAVLTRTVAIAILAAAVPAAAWLLHQAAAQAYASRVQVSPAPATTPQPHAIQQRAALPASTGAPAAPAQAAPDAFAYQAAHALQDGLAGQAGGLPVTVAALLWAARARRRPVPAASEPAGEGVPAAT